MTPGRGSGIRAGAFALGGLLSLVSLPLLVRHLGVGDFGQYVGVIAVVGIALLASDLGITSIALREYTSAEDEHRPALFQGLLGARLAISAVGALAAVGFAAAAGWSADAVWGTALASLSLFPQVLADLLVVALLVESQFGRVALVDLSRSAAGTMLIVILVLADRGLVWFLGAYSLAAAVGAAVALSVVKVPIPVRPRLPRGPVRRVLSDSIAYAVAAAVYVVYFRAVMLVTSVKASPTEAGYFGSAFRVTEFAAAAAGLLAATMTPALTRNTDEGAAYDGRASRFIVASAAIGLGVTALVAIAAPIIVRILGGDALEPAIGVFRVQAIAMGLVFPVFAIGAVLLVLRRHRDLLVANAVALAAAILGALALVPDHGARGAALAAVTAEAMLLLAQGAALGRAMSRRVSPEAG